MSKLYNSVATSFSALAIPDFKQVATWNNDYVPFGETNLLPIYIANLTELSPTHSAIIEAKRNFLNGNLSVDIANEGQDVLDYDDINGRGDTMEELIDSLNGDLSVYESMYVEAIYNEQKTRIVQLNHIPYENVRVGKYDEKGHISSIYISTSWDKKYLKKHAPSKLPIFNTKKISSASQVMVLRVKRPAQPYYTVPAWMSSVQWILLEDDIAELNRNDVTNGFFPSMILNFFGGEPTDDEKSDMEGYINRKFKGASGSKLMTFYGNDPEKKVQMDTFEAPNLGEYSDKMVPIIESKILSAHRAPASLAGVSTSSGFSNTADEIDVAFQLYLRGSIVPLQKLFITALGKVYKFNNIEAEISFENELLTQKEEEKDDAANAEVNSEEAIKEKAPDKPKDINPKEEDDAQQD